MIFLFYFLLTLLFSIDGFSQGTGPGGNSMGLSPGLATNPTVYNFGSQSAQPGKSPLGLQFFYEGHATSCQINATCGSTNDSGKVLVATASGITFTLPNPGVPGTAFQNFGYNGTNSYTLTTVNGTAQIFGCGVSGTSIVVGYATQLIPTGSAYQCVPSSGVSTNGTQTWSGGNSQTPVTLTDAPTIAVNALTGNIFSVTLGGNRILGCPTGVPSGQHQFLSFDIQQDATGGRTLTPSTSCYKWTGSSTPVFSTAANALDSFTCRYRAPSSDLICGPPLLAFGTAALPTVLRSTIAAAPAASPTFATTLNGYTGHPLIVGIFNCDDGNCLGPGTAVVTSVTDNVGSSCAFISNTLTISSSLVTQIWLCTGGSSGNDTVTALCSGGNGCFYTAINLVEVSVISGVGERGNHISGTTQNISIPLSGNTTGSNEFVYSIANKSNEPPTSGQISISVNGNTVSSYQIGGSPAIYTNTYTGTNSATNAASIAAFR